MLWRTTIAGAARLFWPHQPQSLLTRCCGARYQAFSSAPAAAESQAQTFAAQPGSLLHICCTDPLTDVHISNQPGVEDAVTLQVGGWEEGEWGHSVTSLHIPFSTDYQMCGTTQADSSSSNPQQQQNLQQRFLIQQLPGGRIIG